MKAKLVEFSLRTRVIVDEDATDEQIIAESYKGIQDKIDNRELGDNLVEVEDDEECPYDPEGLDKNPTPPVNPRNPRNREGLSAKYAKVITEDELVEKLCAIKGNENNTIDLNAYAIGLADMFKELNKNKI